MSITKKIFVGVMALCLAFSGVAMVNADEESDIRDDMNTLEQMLADLAEQLGADVDEDVDEDNDEPETTVSITGIPENFTFTQNLTTGSRGTDVKNLQIMLNATGFTVAGTGAGSAGNETEYFGPLTGAAVKKFQTEYASEVLHNVGLTTATGYVGPSTRAKLNAMLATGEVAPAPTPDNEILEALAELSDAVAALSARVDALDPKTAPGEPGELTVAVSPDIYGVDVRPERTGVKVAKFDFEAEENDLVIQRLDVAFATDADLDGGNGDIATGTFRSVIDGVAVYYDGEEVGYVEATRANVNDDSAHHTYVRITGLNIEIAEDTTESITIAIDTDDHSSTDTWYVGFAKDGIRFLDGTGRYSYNDSATSTRSFKLEDTAAADIEVELSSDSPDEAVVFVKETSLTNDVELARFDVTVEDGDVEFNDVEIRFSSESGGADLDVTIARARLYADGAFVEEKTSFASDPAENVTFDLDYLAVAEDETVELKVVVDLYGMDEISTEGTAIKAGLNRFIDYYDVSDDDYKTTAAINEEGELQHLYTAVISTVLDDEALDLNEAEDEGDALLEFTITAVNNALTPLYVGFTNTGSGTPSAPVVEVDGNEINSAVLDGTRTVTGTALDSAAVIGEYYVITASDNATYPVNSVILGAATNTDVTDQTPTDFIGYSDAVAGYVVAEWDDATDGFDELKKGDEVTVLLELRIAGADTRERLKVTSIAWQESEEDRPAEWDTDWDAIDILQTVRKYINT